jgi:hypothetical protein
MCLPQVFLPNAAAGGGNDLERAGHVGGKASIHPH